jgi:RNA methyltransferase, TrmH family
MPRGHAGVGDPAPSGVLGATNHRIRRLRRLLTSRRDRLREGVIVLEGPSLAAECLGRGPGGLEAFVERGYDHPVVAALAGAGVVVHQVEPGVLERVLTTTTPQPLAVVAPAPVEGPLPAPAERPLVVVVDLRDPGNAGTLLRTAEAAGTAGVVLAGGSVDPDGPKVLRASAGARLRVPVWRRPDPAAALEELEAQGWATAATVVVPDAVAYDELGWGGTAVVLGNESHGLSAELVGRCTHRVTIPLAGPTESLNVAVAGAVICFEALRQRRTRPGANPLDNHTVRGQR